MQAYLETLTIQNFKGIRDLRIGFTDSTRIYGCNATGKTTIFDAFTWLLFDKGSDGRSQFAVKPLDERGEVIHNVDTLVEAHFLVDGKPVSFRRIQHEKWEKRRMQLESTYTGDTSAYWVNDVEVKATDYKEYVAQLVSESIFKLVTNPAAFNALKWEERRSILIGLIDSDVDETLLASGQYEDIARELTARNVPLDGLRKVLEDQRKQINAELQLLPARIDEVRRMLPDMKPNEVGQAHDDAQRLAGEIAHVDDQLAAIAAQSEDEVRRREIERLLQERAALKSRLDSEHVRLVSSARIAANEAEADLNLKHKHLRDAENTLSADTAALGRRKEAAEKIRQEYRAEYEAAYVSPKFDSLCPTCGQELAAEHRQAMIEKAKQQHLEVKKSKLAEIIERGKAAADAVTAKERDQKAASDALGGIRDELAEIEKRLEIALASLDALPSLPNYDANADYSALTARLCALQDQPNTSPTSMRQELQDRKTALTQQRETALEILRRSEQRERLLERCNELETTMTNLGVKRTEVEALLLKIEELVMERCSKLEDSINTRFPTVRFKLFEIQKNSIPKDTCICLVGGVPYPDANNAARINAGLEIINVLSDHYGVAVPVFVDNAESVNYLVQTRGQLISLIVSSDAQLRIENQKEAA